MLGQPLDDVARLVDLAALDRRAPTERAADRLDQRLRANATIPAAMLSFFMALLSSPDSTPRAYRLKAGNAGLPISTSYETFPRKLCFQVKTALLSAASLRLVRGTCLWRRRRAGRLLYYR
jgi:hypothetical protein